MHASVAISQVRIEAQVGQTTRETDQPVGVRISSRLCLVEAISKAYLTLISVRIRCRMLLILK